MWRNEQGNGMVEVLMVLCIMLLFGIAGVTLLLSGSNTLQRERAEQEAQDGARVALSYLTVRMRQCDVTDGVSIAEPINGQSCLVLHYEDENDPSADYDMWVFWADGWLQEVLAGTGETPVFSGANQIAQVDSFQTKLKDGVLTNTMGYHYDADSRTISNAIYLRSGQE
jgi:hypothetical protein